MNCDLVFVSDPSILVQANTQLKNDSFILAQSFFNPAQALALKSEFAKTGLTVRLCHVMFKPNAKDIAAFKGKVDLIAFVGGTAQANKFAVSTKGIDILLNPTSDKKFEFDQSLATVARQNDVKIGFLASELLTARGFRRMKLFRNYAFVCKLLEKYKVKTFMFSGARNEFELRSTRDLHALLVFFGFSREKALKGSKNAFESIFEKPKVFEVIEEAKKGDADEK